MQESQERQEKAKAMKSVIESVIQTRFKQEGVTWTLRKNGVLTSVYIGAFSLIVALLLLESSSVFASYSVLYSNIDDIRIHDDIINIHMDNSASISLFV